MGKVRASAPAMQGLEPYDPKSLPADVFISANESPIDVPAEVREAIVERVKAFQFNRYPDPLANGLRDLLAQSYGLKRDNVLLGNGGDELLFDIFATWGGPGRKMLDFVPTFSVYQLNAHLSGTQVVTMEREGDDFHINREAAVQRVAEGDIDIVVITTPNNPTGDVIDSETILAIAQASDALVLVDEAYGEFAPGCSILPHLAEHENILILHTFSKAYRAAGIRLGYFLGAESVISEFKKVRQPYSVDAMSQLVGEEIWKRRELFQPGIDDTIRMRGELAKTLECIDGVKVFPSKANYLMIRVSQAQAVWQRLYDEHSVLVRNWSSNPYLPDCLRVTIGTEEENDKFVAALKAVLTTLA